MVTVTLQFSVSLIVTVTFELFSSLWTLSLWILQLLMITVTLKFTVFLIVIVSLNCLARFVHWHTAFCSVPNVHCHFELFSSLWSLSNCIFQCSSWSLSLWSVHLVMVTVTLRFSVFLMVNVTLKFSTPHDHCHYIVFSSLWLLSHCNIQCSSCSLSL